MRRRVATHPANVALQRGYSPNVDLTAPTSFNYLTNLVSQTVSSDLLLSSHLLNNS